MALQPFPNVLYAVALTSLGMTVSSPGLAAETNPHVRIGVAAGACQSCHASIGSSPQPDARWQRAASQRPRALYATYEGATFDGARTRGGPGSASLVCLSCHDGTVSGSVHAERRSLGHDLSDDHPIGFVYDASLAAEDGGLHDPGISPSGLGGSIAQDLLVNGRLECTSCHDPHQSTGERPYLRMSNLGSGLCLTCHDK